MSPPRPAPVLSKSLPLLSRRSLPPYSLRPLTDPRPLPRPRPFPVTPCPVLAANLTVPISLPVSHCSHTRHTLTTALFVGGPCGPQKGQAGIRGSAPPRKVGVPSSGRAHISLAGRFFPSTMRMNSELRLAIVGPRRGVLARGEPDARVQGSGRWSGGRWTGRRGGRAPLGLVGKRGGGGIAPTSFTPPPPHVRRGGHSPWADQSEAGAPRGGRGRPEPRRSLGTWGGLGEGSALRGWGAQAGAEGRWAPL